MPKLAPKKIEAYTHAVETLVNEVDPYVNKQENWGSHPCYYVSVVDGPRHGLLAGPFKSHPEALALVDQAKALAKELDPKAVFYAFGTCKVNTGHRDGILNAKLGVLA